MAAPRFSIVIPTVDRHELLEKTIAACLLSRYANLEVLVSDNYCTPDTARVVQSFRSDPRVRYVRTDRRLSMPDHWEFAWQRSTGDYVIINGDDDAIAPHLVERLSQIATTLDAGLISWDAGLYFHPDWNLSGRNSFVFSSGHSGLLMDIDPQAVFASYARLEIPPCFPQGTRICFSRALANRAVERTGRVFWAPYPDYSAPLLLLGLLGDKRYIYWDALGGFGGRSRESNAAAWDKEGGKAGSSQRAKDYFTELQQEDLYPHSPLKFKAYCNGHVETLNLLRGLLPEAAGRHQVDQTALIAAVECELRGIGIHNPFLGPQERLAFDQYVAQQDPAAVRAAMKIVNERWINDSIEVWRNDRTRISMPVLFYILTLQQPWDLFLRVMRQAYLRSRKRRNGEPSPGGAGLDVAFKRRGFKVYVDCSSFGAANGFDFIRRFEDVVAVCDSRDARNLLDFFGRRFLTSAHEPSRLSDVRQ